MQELDALDRTVVVYTGTTPYQPAQKFTEALNGCYREYAVLQMSAHCDPVTRIHCITAIVTPQINTNAYNKMLKRRSQDS